jgi:hypothetical protein
LVLDKHQNGIHLSRDFGGHFINLLCYFKDFILDCPIAVYNKTIEIDALFEELVFV